MNTKSVFIVGFMLFAMFFGAGNLIFPPKLGYQSGEYFWPAIIGFIFTGVGLPLISIIVGSISKGGYKESLKVIHPIFAVVFMVLIYLTIGPFFAIPRTATTAYELSVVPFLNSSGWLALFIFTVIFFIFVFFMAFSPNKIAERVGQMLTPIMLVVIVIYIARAIMLYFSNDINTVQESFNTSSPFGTGFTEGYLTMDAIAAIAFSVIVLNAIRNYGVASRRELLFGTMKSASIAALLLGVIYLLLAWIGNKVNVSAISEAQDIGTFILSYVANDMFGIFGVMLLGLIVLLACLTTAIGLVVAISEYFHGLFPKVPYTTFATIFTIISFILANQGLSQIITGSIPVLLLLYPIGITCVFLLIVTYFVPSPRFSLQLPVILVSLVSLISIGKYFYLTYGVEFLSFTQITDNLPLSDSSLEWLIFAIIGYLIGYLLSFSRPKVEYK